MKKIILFLAAIAMVGLTSCNSCGSNSNEQKKSEDSVEVYHDYDGVVQDFTAGVSKIQALHKQTMYSLIKGDEYQWRNSRVMFNEKVTFDNIDDLHVVLVRDVFQYWNDGPCVQFITSDVEKGTQIPWPVNDVWIEDASMNDAPIELSAEDALTRLKEWNGILPKDCDFITLRLPLGPKACNPQWTFGDVYNVLFIDAVTGEVKDTNPAF